MTKGLTRSSRTCSTKSRVLPVEPCDDSPTPAPSSEETEIDTGPETKTAEALGRAPASAPRRADRGRHSGWVAAVGVALLVVGLVWLLSSSPSPSGPSEQDVARAGDPATPSSSPRPDRAIRAAWVPGAPRRVLIPALAVDAAVMPVKAPGRSLVPPSDPHQLGWWADGARPGEAAGSALVAGHTVHNGSAALNDLEELRTGDQVRVRTDRGRVDYLVASVRTYTKGALAQHAERLFRQDGPGRLVLVTCEDWDGEQYLSNMVVTATPVRGRP